MNINKEQIVYKKIIDAFKERSTCERIRVSSIIVKDGRIISTGWNGVPSGKKHCTKHFKEKYKEPYNIVSFNDEHRVFSERYEKLIDVLKYLKKLIQYKHTFLIL